MHVIIGCALAGLFVLAGIGLVAGQDGKGFAQDLDVIRSAASNTLRHPAVRIVSKERTGFWGVWMVEDGEDAGSVVQVDDTDTVGNYSVNVNANAGHDFHNVQLHRRERNITFLRGTAPPGFGSIPGQSKTLSETFFRNGTMYLKMRQASVAVFNLLPEGWFDVTSFSLAPNLPPAVSFLKFVDFRFLLRQSELLDLTLLRDEFVVDVQALESSSLAVEGTCYSVKFDDPGFALRTALGLSVNDFSGLGITEVFLYDLYSAADLFLEICVSQEESSGESLVVATRLVRNGTDIETRLAGRDVRMTFLADKNTTFDHVDSVEFPTVNGVGRNLVHGWHAIFLGLCWLFWLGSVF